jgi:hypothetical protein
MLNIGIIAELLHKNKEKAPIFFSHFVVHPKNVF